MYVFVVYFCKVLEIFTFWLHLQGKGGKILSIKKTLEASDRNKRIQQVSNKRESLSTR